MYKLKIEFCRMVIRFLVIFVSVIFIESLCASELSASDSNNNILLIEKSIKENSWQSLDDSSFLQPMNASQKSSKQIVDVKAENAVPKLRELISNNEGSVLEANLLTKRLSEEYWNYKEEIITSATSVSETPNFRMQLIEIMSQNWGDMDSRKNIRSIFEAGDMSSSVTAYAAKHLAENGVDIGDRIIAEYSNVNVEVRPFYMFAIKSLRRNDAVEFVRQELRKSLDMNERLAAIEALGALADEDLQSTSELSLIVQKAGGLVDGQRPEAKAEIEAMRAVASIGRIGASNIELLLTFAGNDALATNIRISAVESLGGFFTLQDVDVADRILKIKNEFLLSERSNSDKIRFRQMINKVTNEINSQ